MTARFLMVAVATLLLGCNTVDQVDLLDAWVGAEEIELVSKWGVPVNTYDNNGIRILAFLYEWTDGKTRLPCTTSFTLKDGVVQSHMQSGQWCKLAKLPER